MGDHDNSGPKRVPVDTVFALLSNSRRRAVLQTLQETEETTLRSLAQRIAATENGVSVDALTAPQRKRVSIGLYQSHLPKLKRAGVIDYDRDRGTVRRTPATAQLDPFLELAVEHEHRLED